MAIQNGRKMIFGGKSPVKSVDTQWVKNFVEIALSRTVCEINAFLHLTQKFKTAAKNGDKAIFGKFASRFCLYPADQKLSKSLYIAPFPRYVFVFYAEIQDGHQNGRKVIFGKSPVDSNYTL